LSDTSFLRDCSSAARKLPYFNDLRLSFVVPAERSVLWCSRGATTPYMDWEAHQLARYLPSWSDTVPEDLQCGAAGLRGSARDHAFDKAAFCCGLAAGFLALRHALDGSKRASTTEARSTLPANKVGHHDDLGAPGLPASVFRTVAVGLMITASHNPPHENGVKFIDTNGGMADPTWIHLAVRLVRASAGPDSLATVLEQVHREKISEARAIRDALCIPVVLLGYDSRSSSPHLASNAQEGARVVLSHYLRATRCSGGETLAFADALLLGMTTTPAMHAVVRAWNESPVDMRESDLSNFRDAFERRPLFLLNRYKSSLVEATRALSEALHLADVEHRALMDHWVVDCANGVGAPLLCELASALRTQCGIQIVCCNQETAQTELLNVQCGADWVQKGNRLPQRWPQTPAGKPERQGASLDGDADRLVCFLADAQGVAMLLDGDQTATLFLDFVLGFLHPEHAYLSQNTCAEAAAGAARKSWRVALVHTVYANGAAVAYWRKRQRELESQRAHHACDIELQIICTWTGVVHLEKEARRFDIGLYFEPNGHGTILFSDALLKSHASTLPLPLRCCARVANQGVGDGIANLLLIATILQWKRWSLVDWATAYYTPLASVYLVERVSDRHQIVTSDYDQRVVEPPELQRSIDRIVASYRSARESVSANESAVAGARIVVRPSGTEDVVRVYAEAHTEADASSLARCVVNEIRRLLGS